MQSRVTAVLRRGVEAALLAGIPQVILPKIEERLFLRQGESADLGPRLIEALAARSGKALPEDLKWLSAAAFHCGYAGLWGALYALAYERRPVPPWVGGLTLSALIHLVTFPRWGAAVLVGAEAPPRERPRRMEVVLVTAPLVFGMGTALLYGRGPSDSLRDEVITRWRKRST